MFLYHLREVAAHAQLRQIAVVEADVDGSVIVGVYYEIGDDLLQVPSDGFTQRCARTGVELGDLFKCLIEVFFVQSQLFDDLFPMLAGELFVTFTDDFFFRLQQRVCAVGLFFAADLYQQAFLQAACAQSGRVEILYDSQGFLQFLFRSVDTGVDGQFVTDAFEGFTEQAVVVQRTDQVFRQFALMFGQVAFAELFSQDLVE